jgi:hypothetical protein
MTAAFMPYALLTSVIVGVAGSLWAYNEGKTAGEQEVLAQVAQDESLRIATRDETLRVVAEQIKGLGVKNETVVRNFKTIEREVPVYRDCVHPAPAIELLNDALRGSEVRTQLPVPGVVP